MVNPIKGHVFIQDNGDGTAEVLEVSDEAREFCEVGQVVNIPLGIKTRSGFNFGPDKKIIHYTDLT